MRSIAAANQQLAAGRKLRLGGRRVKNDISDIPLLPEMTDRVQTLKHIAGRIHVPILSSCFQEASDHVGVDKAWLHWVNSDVIAPLRTMQGGRLRQGPKPSLLES